MYATLAAVRGVLDPDYIPGSTEAPGPAQTAAELSDARLQQAIDDAAARVNTYLAARYTVPVAPLDPAATTPVWDATLATLTTAIAAYLASLTFYRNQPMADDDPVRRRYVDALADLTAIRDGKLTLPIPVEQDPAVGGGFAGVIDPGTGGLFDAADAGYHHQTGWWGSPLAWDRT